MRKNSTLKGLMFIMPWLLGFLIFNLYPIIASFYYSLTEYFITTKPKFVGFSNYKSMFSDPLFWKSLTNTLLYVVGLVPLGLVVALGIALLLNIKQLKGVSVFRATIYLPSIVPAFAFSAVVTLFFHPYIGFVNTILSWFGIEGPLWLSSETWVKPTIIIAAQWGVGGAMLIFSAALKDIPSELYEAARIDGASKFTMFTKITLPLITPTIFYYLVTSTIGNMQIFDLPMLLTGGGPANASMSLGMYIYNQAFKYTNMGYASALSWILFGFIIMLTLLYFGFSKKWVFYMGKN
ncbi:MAG: carbohydrate ABC transporter permease [Fervidobacterium sp.]|uniref:carbohydrate ABC transporter permease n=1 Tax=Fervidobacterium sp. TaxID=1871331 RepID=UPI0040490967